MGLLDVINSTQPKTEKAFATVTGQLQGRVKAKTTGGATIILTGAMETGKKVWYDRRTSTILSEAPDVSFSEFGI